MKNVMNCIFRRTRVLINGRRAWACACVKAQHDSLDLKCISMPMATRRVAAL